MSTVPLELPKTKAEKVKAAEEVDAAIDKKFGEGSVFNMAKQSKVEMPHIATGIYGLDYDVLGIGGFPTGRIVELLGVESGGKTTLALTLIASAQREGGLCCVIDVENSMEPAWCIKNGVDVKSLRVSQPSSGEEALEIAMMLIESGAYSVVVVDSVSALTPQAEIDGDISDANIGLQARLMSKALRMLSSKVRKSGTILVFVNQLRERIGQSYGDNTTTSGGRALRFYASVRLDIRKVQVIKEGDVAIGNLVRITAKKNKIGIPYRQAEVDLLFDRGFNAEGNLLDIAAESDIIIKSGAWYSFEGERIGQGRTKAVETLRQSLDMQKKVLALLTEKRTKQSEVK